MPPPPPRKSSEVEIEEIELEHSRLEATLVTANVEQRPMSRDGTAKNRHAEEADMQVNELDLDYDIDVTEYPLSTLDSAQGLLSTVLYHEHLKKRENFSKDTKLDCLAINVDSAAWKTYDEHSLRELLQDTSARWNNVVALSTGGSDTAQATPKSAREALFFFAPLTATSGASWGRSLSMTQASVHDLFRLLSLNPAFLLNLLGRGDYWAPQQRWDKGNQGKTLACDFFCQHPRWNLQVQGAPLSVYMKYDVQRDLIIYLISHTDNDTIVRCLRSLLATALRHPSQQTIRTLLLDSPLDLHVLLSTLSFEASKYHVKRFQRVMWKAVNAVDDQLSTLATTTHDRSKLSDLTRQLQVVSQNSDSHDANAEVFLFTARGIRDMVQRLTVSRRPDTRQRTLDSIEYAMESMKKQQMWFQNYKQRVNNTMNTIYQLITQSDAASNMSLATDMKRDSTSMKSIAALTMVFLPGTFTASLLSANIFSVSSTSPQRIESSILWWVFVAITVPLTLLVMACWYCYQRWISRGEAQQREWLQGERARWRRVMGLK